MPDAKALVEFMFLVVQCEERRDRQFSTEEYTVLTRFFYHATDGDQIIVDHVGLRLGSMDLEEGAALLAVHLRRRFGVLADLSEWLVVVQDRWGCHVETFALAELPEIVEQDLLAA